MARVLLLLQKPSFHLNSMSTFLLIVVLFIFFLACAFFSLAETAIFVDEPLQAPSPGFRR